MADGRHGGHRAAGDGTGHRLRIEGEQVLEAAAAAGQQHQVGRQPRNPVQGIENLRLGFHALDGYWQQGDLKQWKAAPNDAQHIPKRGAGRRGDHGQMAWIGGQGALALLGKEALGGEARFERLIGGAQGAFPGRLHVLHDDLELTPVLIQAHPPAQQHLAAVARLHPAQAVAVDEHRAAHLRGVVLQGEVPVAGAGPGEVGNLAANPDEVEALLKQPPGALVEVADGEYGGFGHGPFRRCGPARTESAPPRRWT